MSTPSLTEPTWFIDSDSAEVGRFVKGALEGVTSDDAVDVSIALFLAVRDGIRYDPYGTVRGREAFRASTVAGSEANWCVPKSVLLTAAARHVGIPARLGFADVRNHLNSEKLAASMGTDVFAWHGYSELYIEGRWLKVSSAFNIELCERFGVKVLDFDGTADALMHPYDESGRRHMEYIRQRGSFDDLPYVQIFDTFDELYPSSISGGRGTDEIDPAFAP